MKDRLKQFLGGLCAAAMMGGPALVVVIIQSGALK